MVFKIVLLELYEFVVLGCTDLEWHHYIVNVFSTKYSKEISNTYTQRGISNRTVLLKCFILTFSDDL